MNINTRAFHSGFLLISCLSPPKMEGITSQTGSHMVRTHAGVRGLKEIRTLVLVAFDNFSAMLKKVGGR